MAATKDSRVSFMDVFSDPMCFSAMYEHLHSKNKATLRLVCKELRDAVNLNVRSLKAEEYNDCVDMPLLVSKLPNLESIFVTESIDSGGVVNVLQGAQLARKLTKLELRELDEEAGALLADEDRERRAEVLENLPFQTIGHRCWPLLQLFHLNGVNTAVSTDAVKALLRLSTLTKLDLHHSRFNNEPFNLIQPDSWPCLRHLDLNECRLDPVVAIRALLHLTGLEELSLQYGLLPLNRGITSKALAQIQPGSWPNLQVLDLFDNGGIDDDPVAAMKALLHLTAPTKLRLSCCKLSGEAISQIRPGDWPHLQNLEMSSNKLNDDPVGAMKALMHLTALTELDLDSCSLTGEAISQIKPGDWPHLQRLLISSNKLSDNPLGAMKGLLCLTALTTLGVMRCELTGEAVSRIKPGDWPHLLQLSIHLNDLKGDKDGAKKGLMHLTSLDDLGIAYCGWNEDDIIEICRALGIKPRQYCYY